MAFQAKCDMTGCMCVAVVGAALKLPEGWFRVDLVNAGKTLRFFVCPMHTPAQALPTFTVPADPQP